ncbi:hypothetical protein N7G274_001635 [Stereocaulon virgatum]|uniref:Uncharacterized protein n=1 Tax=Stereocaulon virgatum TaxID=373712 RepID=A0ABR4AM45_9LECA
MLLKTVGTVNAIGVVVNGVGCGLLLMLEGVTRLDTIDNGVDVAPLVKVPEAATEGVDSEVICVLLLRDEDSRILGDIFESVNVRPTVTDPDTRKAGEAIDDVD